MKINFKDSKKQKIETLLLYHGDKQEYYVIKNTLPEEEFMEVTLNDKFPLLQSEDKSSVCFSYKDKAYHLSNVQLREEDKVKFNIK